MSFGGRARLGGLAAAGVIAAALAHGCRGSDDEAPPIDAPDEGPAGGAAIDRVAPADVADAADRSGSSDASDASIEAVEAGGDASFDAGACPAGALAIPPLRLAPVSPPAFSSGVFAAQPPGSADWYVVEQGGVVKILRDGAVLPTPFLDVRAGIGTGLNERGLLGIAFHPDYANNGRFFVMGTPGESPNGTFAPKNVDAVIEFKRSAANPDIADATKVRDIVVLPASAPNHNAGALAFGPDGMLYAGTGDGGGACESSNPGTVQDLTSLLGKFLRLDVDKPAPFAPASGPFPGDTRIHHYGLRNPFRWSFDSLTGDLYIGDVGQSSFEEISFAPADAPGKNFGWPAFEGDAAGTCPGKVLGGPAPHTPPIVSIDRRTESTSPFKDYTAIMGGRVYRGAAIPSLFGAYMFADFVGKNVGFVRVCGGRVEGPIAVPKTELPLPDVPPNAITAILEGNDHELYVLTSYAPARLAKVVPR